MPLQPNGAAPYTTAVAATTVLDAWRDRGLGTPVNAETLVRAGVPESLARRTFQSLVALELLNEDGTPTEQFQDFRSTRGDDEYRTRLEAWLHGVYADVLQYANPSSDSHERVTEAFRTYEPAGQRRAMGALLLGLWRYAGLPIAGGEPNSPPRRKTAPTQRRGPKKLAHHKTKDTNTRPTPHGSGVGLETDLPAGLVGLLHQIPPGGRSWTSQRRDDFLKAFQAVLDFSVPVDDNPPILEEEPEELSQV